MAKYLVSGRQVHIITVEVEAESEDEALDAAHCGEGDAIDDEIANECIEYYNPRLDTDDEG